MAKFRRKPVVVDAFQMTREARTTPTTWPEWVHSAWNLDHDQIGCLEPILFPHSNGKDELTILTADGRARVFFGDYIIKDADGELYSCRSDVFAKIYERVSPAEKEWSDPNPIPYIPKTKPDFE